MCNKKNSVIIFVLIALIFMCCKNEMRQINSPLAVVMKLNSAEAFLDFDEAKKYMDIDLVYGKYATKEKSIDSVWQEYIASAYKISRSRIFSNHWQYYAYDISETISGDTAEVIFNSKNSTEDIKRIVYSLENRKEGWSVINIEFVR